MKASLFGETIPELKEIIDRVPRHVYMSKFRNDGFERYGDNEEKPSAWLKENGVDSVYFMGVNTDACVYSSASSATEVYDLNIVSTKDVIATSECYDDCADAFKGFNLFLEKGAFGEDHRIFIDYLRKAF